MLKLHKRMIAVLLTITMILSVFVVAPFSVSAATYNYLFPVNNGGAIAYAYGYSAAYGGNHTGIDIHSNGDDTIYAATDGTVVATANSCGHVSCGYACEHYSTYGNYIKIRNSDGTYAYYGHLKKDGIKVSTGMSVSKGQAIAIMGSSGYSTGKHLHFELRLSDEKTTVNVNPASSGGSVNYSYSGYGTHTPTDKPGKPNLSSNKSVYPYGETVTLSWENVVNATNYWLDFYKDGVKVDGRSVSSPLVLKDLDPGKYSAYITANNAIGKTTSDVCNFEVFKSAPGKPQLTSNKSMCPYGDDLTLSWNATMYATNYWLDFYKDGVKVDGRSVSSPLVLTELEPGEYAAYITATNPFGQTTSNVCTFEVFNSAPGKPHITLSKSEYLRGEDVTLTWDEPMYSNNYWLDFYKDGVKVDGRSVSSPLVFTDLEPGKYAVYITANNLFGHTTSDVCNFEVKDDESELPLYGDANDDGDVNIQDATIVQMVVAKFPVENFNEKLADYDQNGEVNIRDATAIQMVVAKLV